MKIDSKLVDKLAKLSHLEFDKKEKEQMTSDLNKIVELVNKLEELDTNKVDPLVYLNTETNVLREDKVGEHLSKEDALKNGPDKDSDYFKVPTVLKK
jgi:aspartyl-tRNA(Asn)/glutamyl-tRNA(Gln) amidotransferase subunit C